MSDTVPPPEEPAAADQPPLARALDQSEQVKAKVEECAVDLASVNVVLQQEVAAGAPLQAVEEALERSERVEQKVQECVDELEQVNDALAEEIDERHQLEEDLAQSDTDLRASRVLERKARHDALHDGLTGLPNQTLLLDRLAAGMAQADRHAWRLAVLFLDLDHFKAVNDTHGHDVGDALLQVVAQRLVEYVRGGDTVARRSGDEFLVLMLEAKDEPTVGGFARQLLDVVSAPCMVGTLSLTVTPSIGVAIYPEDGRTPAELLKRADLAMYAVKRLRGGTRPDAPGTI